jgi:hypothetical protein
MIGTMAYVALRVSIVSLGLLWGAAHAQVTEPVEADPPSRAARLSHIEGDVSLRPVGEEVWAPAPVNRPLTTGDRIWTERDARAEIHVGPAAVRLDGTTGFSFLDIDDDTIQMRLTAGVIHVTVSRLEGSEQIEIDTPNVALWLLRTGTYRVEVDEEGDSTVVKVREGAVDARSPSQDIVVHAGQSVTFDGTDDIVAQIHTLGSPDDFDAWSEERARRDARMAASRTAQYVSPDVTGYEDLEDHGTWSSEADYGYVWTPRNVAVDWAPYRYGRWVWVSPWGWTWLDDARWGYAPFHYGRWVHLRHRWCWVPGPRHHRAFYAPALVAWIGSPGLHVTWYPLGPRDVYVPWRRHSWRYVDRVNTSNAVGVIREHIRDAYERRAPRHRHRAPPGVTRASSDAFTLSRRVRDHLVRVDDRELSGGFPRAAAPRLDPRRESRLGGSQTSVHVPPRRIADRQVVVRRTPSQVVANLVREPARDRVARDFAPDSSRPESSRAGFNPNPTERPLVRRDRPDRPSSDVAQTLRDRRMRDGTSTDDGARRWRTPDPEPTVRETPVEQDSMGQRLREVRERRMREQRSPADTWRQADGVDARDRAERRREPDVQQRWQTQGDIRQPREQRAPDPHQVIRERFQQRPAEHRPVERREVEQRAVPRPNVPRMDTPRAPRPQPEQRPARTEAPRQASPPPQQSPRRDENFSRARRQ